MRKIFSLVMALFLFATVLFTGCGVSKSKKYVLDPNDTVEYDKGDQSFVDGNFDPESYDNPDGTEREAVSGVVFDANGGRGNMSKLTMREGETKTLTKNAFRRDGYSFMGWSKISSGTVPDYADMAEYTQQDELLHTLYAVWKKDVYTVNFFTVDGELLLSANVEYNGTVVAPSNVPAPPAGKIFNGFYDKSHKKYFAEGMKFTSNADFYVEYKEEIAPSSDSFDFSALSDESKWTYNEDIASRVVFDETNSFVTVREKSNVAVNYTANTVTSGDIDLLLKASVFSDTTISVVFALTAEDGDYTKFCYDDGIRCYAVELYYDGGTKMHVKKWNDGEDTELSGSKSEWKLSTAESYRIKTGFKSLKITVSEVNGAVNVRVFFDNNEKLNVTDNENPYIGGGYVGLSCNGTGGVAVGSAQSSASTYTAPAEAKFTIYDQPDEEIYSAAGDLDMLNYYTNNWTGRSAAGIYNVQNDGQGYVFTSAPNSEEPQSGVTEYQGMYKSKIFKDAQFEYTFNQLASGEWTMFWLRCIASKDATDVSIWGNKDKSKRQYTNGYSVLITNAGYVQVHKWSDGTQMWLNGQGTQISGLAGKLSNPEKTITVKLSIQEVEISAGVRGIRIKIQVDDKPLITIDDNDQPFFNAGYVGVQGYALNNNVIETRILSAKASANVTL